MLRELFYILCCLGLGGIWGFNIYKGVKNKSKFEIIYSSIVTGIFCSYGNSKNSRKFYWLRSDKLIEHNSNKSIW